jgi:hypothetical protein
MAHAQLSMIYKREHILENVIITALEVNVTRALVVFGKVTPKQRGKVIAAPLSQGKHTAMYVTDLLLFLAVLTVQHNLPVTQCFFRITLPCEWDTGASRKGAIRVVVVPVGVFSFTRGNVVVVVLLLLLLLRVFL